MPTSRAQHQEASLIDRLLRPNMELRNNAQGKKFVTDSAPIEKRGTVGTFFIEPTRQEKSFADTRALSAPKYVSGSFHRGADTAVSFEDRKLNAQANISVTSVPGIHDTYDAHSTIVGRSSTDQRPFREQGKSQKSLDRLNPPLTIEQVRELLNKNK